MILLHDKLWELLPSEVFPATHNRTVKTSNSSSLPSSTVFRTLLLPSQALSHGPLFSFSNATGLIQANPYFSLNHQCSTPTGLPEYVPPIYSPSALRCVSKMQNLYSFECFKYFHCCPSSEGKFMTQDHWWFGSCLTFSGFQTHQSTYSLPSHSLPQEVAEPPLWQEHSLRS